MLKIGVLNVQRCKKVCPQFEKNQIKVMKKILTIKGHKPNKKTMKPFKNSLKNTNIRTTCKKILCNPTCAGTPYQDRSKITNKSLLSARKIVGNKERIIKNGFYEGLSPDVISKLKKSGALSGCKAF
jgi:hypothetical protein